MAPAPGAPLCRTSRARQLRTKAVASWRCTYQKLSKGVVHQLMADSLAKLNASCKSHFDIGDSPSPISLPFYVHLWLTGWQAGWLDWLGWLGWLGWLAGTRWLAFSPPSSLPLTLPPSPLASVIPPSPPSLPPSLPPPFRSISCPLTINPLPRQSPPIPPTYICSFFP